MATRSSARALAGRHAWLSGRVPLPPITQMMPAVQGEVDDVVPFSHGQQLHKLLKHPFPPLFSPIADHQNLEDDPQFMPKLNDFMQHLFGADYSRNSKF